MCFCVKKIEVKLDFLIFIDNRKSNQLGVRLIKINIDSM